MSGDTTQYFHAEGTRSVPHFQNRLCGYDAGATFQTACPQPATGAEHVHTATLSDQPPGLPVDKSCLWWCTAWVYETVAAAVCVCRSTARCRHPCNRRPDRTQCQRQPVAIWRRSRRAHPGKKTARTCRRIPRRPRLEVQVLALACRRCQSKFYGSSSKQGLRRGLQKTRIPRSAIQ